MDDKSNNIFGSEEDLDYSNMDLTDMELSNLSNLDFINTDFADMDSTANNVSNNTSSNNGFSNTDSSNNDFSDIDTPNTDFSNLAADPSLVDTNDTTYNESLMQSAYESESGPSLNNQATDQATDTGSITTSGQGTLVAEEPVDDAFPQDDLSYGAPVNVDDHLRSQNSNATYVASDGNNIILGNEPLTNFVPSFGENRQRNTVFDQDGLNSSPFGQNQASQHIASTRRSSGPARPLFGGDSQPDHLQAPQSQRSSLPSRRNGNIFNGSTAFDSWGQTVPPATPINTLDHARAEVRNHGFTNPYGPSATSQREKANNSSQNRLDRPSLDPHYTPRSAFNAPATPEPSSPVPAERQRRPGMLTLSQRMAMGATEETPSRRRTREESVTEDVDQDAPENEQGQEDGNQNNMTSAESRPAKRRKRRTTTQTTQATSTAPSYYGPFLTPFAEAVYREIYHPRIPTLSSRRFSSNFPEGRTKQERENEEKQSKKKDGP